MIKVQNFHLKSHVKGVGRNRMDWRGGGIEERSGEVLSSRITGPCRAEPEKCKGCPGPASSAVTVTEYPEPEDGGTALQNGYFHF